MMYKACSNKLEDLAVVVEEIVELLPTPDKVDKLLMITRNNHLKRMADMIEDS